MIMDLPKTFKWEGVTIKKNELIIDRPVNYESLMYELTYLLKGRNRCQYCNCKMKKLRIGTMDHAYPRVTGGISLTNNLVPCCGACNVKKSDLTPEEFLIAKDFSDEELEKYILERRRIKREVVRYYGFILNPEWVTYIDANDIIMDIRGIDKGKAYYKILKFYRETKKFPAPVVIDRKNQLMQGINILIVAKDVGAERVPVVKLENVLLGYGKN